MIPKPLVLCILDGWGESDPSPFNAISQAHKPTWDRWMNEYPHSLLDASGPNVGLPVGQMGNSEVGHMTIGAGRVIFQDLPRITKAFQKGEVASNPILNSLIKTLRYNGKTCHLMGLLSPGGVHSHIGHILGLIKILNAEKIPVALHAFLDGRDTPPKSALLYLQDFLSQISDYKNVQVATLIGRYFSMDRDQRWDRTEKAYKAIVYGEGITFQDPLEAIQHQYDQGITDEFIPPLIASTYPGVQDQDGFLMANFRADRARQLLHVLGLETFSKFERGCKPPFSKMVAMTDYGQDLSSIMDILFPQYIPINTLGEILSKAGLKQLRIAETEKYAHVTFFLNGGREESFSQEDRILIPSPQVATYDLKPEMSAQELTDRVIIEIKKNYYDVIIINYANTDMVGHSGKMEPTIKAVEVIDSCLGQLEKMVLQKKGILLVTADHGNAEQMEDSKTHQPHTAHTTNLVPFVIVGSHSYALEKNMGTLADIVSTILDILRIPKPVEVEGETLLKHSLLK